jgi:hypothetical protein
MIVQAMVSATASTTNIVEFSMRTDFWPDEISWELRDSEGNLIDSDASYPALTCDSRLRYYFHPGAGPML